MSGQSRPDGPDMITMFTDAYRVAGDGGARLPWDWSAPHPHLERWARERRTAGTGRSAIVVGCGYGDDAAFVASLGFRTTAFDFVAAAIEGARRRHPTVDLDLRVADLFALPPQWAGAFDLVVESLTVQSIPPARRAEAVAAIARLAAPGGTVLVIASALEDEPDRAGPPWPLDRADVERFAEHGLEPVMINRWERPDRVQLSPWIAEYRR
ncbi:methyltransferase domain-containing protein [Microlunatus speluncae]|uniref:methyltransferase domain-containing protein n=1 Tax=Microlunatus speluncae TaxID=2594267 RepID=UPI0013754812|nr:methyltransferase domain-containing protein [Microlunatus speluncae]